MHTPCTFGLWLVSYISDAFFFFSDCYSCFLDGVKLTHKLCNFYLFFSRWFRLTTQLFLLSGFWCLLIMDLLREWDCKAFVQCFNFWASCFLVFLIPKLNKEILHWLYVYVYALAVCVCIDIGSPGEIRVWWIDDRWGEAFQCFHVLPVIYLIENLKSVTWMEKIGAVKVLPLYGSTQLDFD